MEFLNISSLEVVYQYVVKIKKKFRHQNKWEFRYENPQQLKYGKDGRNKQPPENHSKPQEKKGNENMKKGIGKWYDLHRIPSLVVEHDYLPNSEVFVSIHVYTP
jgi:hypothetical protein